MEISAKSIARLIDISAIRTHHSKSEIQEVVRYGKEYGFISVHTLTC